MNFKELGAAMAAVIRKNNTERDDRIAALERAVGTLERKAEHLERVLWMIENKAKA